MSSCSILTEHVIRQGLVKELLSTVASDLAVVVYQLSVLYKQICRAMIRSTLIAIRLCSHTTRLPVDARVTLGVFVPEDKE